jgi:hypothetical protein
LDIGPGITHREKAVELFIEGKDSVAIARELKHSLKAVERYIHTFCRVVYCQAEFKDNLKTALVIGVTVALVNKYLALRDRYWNTEAYRERLSEIEQVGTRFWVCQDSKKSLGGQQGGANESYPLERRYATGTTEERFQGGFECFSTGASVTIRWRFNTPTDNQPHICYD